MYQLTNMRPLIILVITLLSTGIYAAEKLDSVTVTYKDTSFTIKIGDELKLGYGKTPYGRFQFIWSGGEPKSYLEKRGGGKAGIIKKIKIYPKANMLQVLLKIPGFGLRVVEIREAIDIGEVVGLNGWIFNKE